MRPLLKWVPLDCGREHEDREGARIHREWSSPTYVPLTKNRSINCLSFDIVDRTGAPYPFETLGGAGVGKRQAVEMELTIYRGPDYIL